MNIRYHILVAVFGLLSLASSAIAQTDFTVDVPTPTRTLDTGGFTTFEFTVRNPSSRTVSVQVHRVVNELPDAKWHSSICSFATCYPEETSEIPAIEVKPGDTTGYTVHITAGSVYGQTGRVVLRFDEGSGSPFLEKEVSVQTVVPPVAYFRVEPETINGAAFSGDTAVFTIWTYNEITDPMTVTVHRVENYFPDDTWSSSICIERDCYAPSIATPPPTTVDGNKAILYKLKVTGITPGIGRVVLRFRSDKQTDPIEKRFNLTIGVAGVAIAEESDGQVVVADDGSLIVSLDRLDRDDLTLKLYDIEGRERLDVSAAARQAARSGTSSLRLDTESLGSGIYLYSITSGGHRWSGRIQVTR